MNNNSNQTETIQKAIQAYHTKFGKGAEPPHEAYTRIAGDQVILASSQNKLAIYNVKEGKISDPVGGFTK